MKCHYCDRDEKIVCQNTRDMEDFSIDGDDVCFAAFEKRGGGERSIESVRIERDRIRSMKAENGDKI